MSVRDEYLEFYFIGQIEMIVKFYSNKTESAEACMKQVRQALAEYDRRSKANLQTMLKLSIASVEERKRCEAVGGEVLPFPGRRK